MKIFFSSFVGENFIFDGSANNACQLYKLCLNEIGFCLKKIWTKFHSKSNITVRSDALGLILNETLFRTLRTKTPSYLNNMNYISSDLLNRIYTQITLFP